MKKIWKNRIGIRMVIVKIHSGLGNQMFQYALYEMLKSLNKEVKYDISYFDMNKCHGGFELNKIFNIDYNLADKDEVKGIADLAPGIISRIRRKIFGTSKKTHYIQKNFGYSKDIFKFDQAYLDGYWQTEKYFMGVSEKIRNVFEFKPELDDKNKSVLLDISFHESVSVHIRRGDYINSPFFSGICDNNYYKNALDSLSSQISSKELKYYLFSDDIQWVKEHLKIENAIYVDWNKGTNAYIDMQLMSNCKHNIIANSSFSWWAAWLNRNPDKIVIAPERWFNDSKMNLKDVIPRSWTKVKIG